MTRYRRREAAELARVLEISTQEAVVVSHLSPHTLSSSGSKETSQDSRELELRMMQGTVRPGDVMGPPPSTDDLGSFSSASGSRGMPSSGYGSASGQVLGTGLQPISTCECLPSLGCPSARKRGAEAC